MPLHERFGRLVAPVAETLCVTILCGAIAGMIVREALAGMAPVRVCIPANGCSSGCTISIRNTCPDTWNDNGQTKPTCDKDNPNCKDCRCDYRPGSVDQQCSCQ